MTEVDGLGYLAATLVLATFAAKNMVSLRILAIGSNIAFITYAGLAALWPILWLHAIMLPLNIIRLREAVGKTSGPGALLRVLRLGSAAGALR